jgi:hypothetical protein
MAMAAVRLQFAHLPSPFVAFLKAPFRGGRGVDGQRTIPPIEAQLQGLRPNLDHVRRYAQLCGYASDHALPLTYPHVMAAPLHLAVMTHRAFPLRLPGLVHVRNSVHQLRPLDRVERLDVSARVEGHRQADKGVEFDLHTQLWDSHGTPVWYSTSTYLAPSRQKRESSGWEPPPLDRYRWLEEWDMPESLGRRYGWLAGDINPIHLHVLTARLFGFRRHIAHGMWAFARSVAGLTRDRSVPTASVDVVFRRPIFLPGRVRLLAAEGDGIDYVVTDPGGETFHLTGRVDAR